MRVYAIRYIVEAPVLTHVWNLWQEVREVLRLTLVIILQPRCAILIMTVWM